MAEQTNIQIDTLARAIQIVTDFLAGRPQQGVASLEQAIARAEAALIKGGLSPSVAKDMSKQILLSAGSRDSSGLSSAIEIARNILDDRQPSFLQGGDGARLPGSNPGDSFGGQGIPFDPGQGSSPRGSQFAPPAPLVSTHRPEITGLTVESSTTQSLPQRPERTQLTGDATGNGLPRPGTPTELSVLTLDGMNPGVLGGSSSGTGSGLANQGTGGVTGGGLGVFANFSAGDGGSTGGSLFSGIGGAPAAPPMSLGSNEAAPPATLPDSHASISAAQAQVVEGDTGSAGVLVFVVTRDNPFTPTSAQWTLSGIDAAQLADGALTGTVNFAAGQTEARISIPLAGNRIIEAGRTVTLQLQAPSEGLLIDQPVASAQVVDDDGTVSISAGQGSVIEGHSGTQVLSFTVVRSTGTGASTVDWALSGMDAADLGGPLPGGTLQFADGETIKLIEITLGGDRTIETDEVLSVILSNPGANLTLGTDRASTTVINDDGTFSITANQASVSEGDQGGSQVLTYTVTRTNAVAADQVSWSTSGLDASDFGGAVPSGTLDFAPGETSKTITVTLAGDRTVEPDETLTVSLSGSGVAQASASTQIINDDGSVSISANQASVVEGFTGDSQTLTYTVTRTQSGFASSVDWTVSGVDAADFGGTLPSGTVVFAPGETSKTITLTLTGDGTPESTEQLTVNLSNPGPNLFIDTASASTTILNDDATVNISAVTTSIAEGGEADTRTLTFNVVRDIGLNASSVEWAVSGLDAAAFGGSLPRGTVSFGVGETSKAITVSFTGDHVIDADRSLTVTLSNPGQSLGIGVGSASTSVLNDDATVSIAAVAADVPEGDEGSTQSLSFTLTRDNGLAASTVNWAASGLDAADVGGPLPSGTVSFAVGELTKTITVPIVGDRSIEPDETLTVTLSNPGANLHLGTTTASTVVLDDDSLVSISANAVQVLEGDTGTQTQVSFTISRADGSAASSVDWSVSGLPAADFGGTLPAGTVHFAVGETSRVITVAFAGDRIVEPDATITATLSNPQGNLRLGDAVASTDIINDDVGFSLIGDTLNVVEGANSSQAALTFHVTRSETFGQEADISWRFVRVGVRAADANDFVSGQDALGGNDGLPSGSIHFGSNEISRTVTVYVKGDALQEYDETFGIVLVNPPPGMQIINGEAYGNIYTDETQYSVSAVTPSTLEGNGTGGRQAFTVTRAGDLSQAGEIGYTLSGYGESPATPDDFAVGQALSGTVSFASGESSKIVYVDLSGDSTLEGYETFAFTLNPLNANTQIDVGTALAVIDPDDQAISIVARDAVRKEGSTVGQPQLFAITRVGDLSGSATVDWQVSGSGANPMNAADFGGTLPSGSVTFAPGESEILIQITPTPDSHLETREDFTVSISSSTPGAMVLQGSATGIVLNDDSGFVLDGNALTTNEGNSNAARQASFTVTRSGDLTVAASVDWALEFAAIDGVDSNDFLPGTLFSGTLSFGRGVNSLVVNLPLTPDHAVEASEGFTVRLSNPSAGSEITVGQSAGLVRNDDVVLTLLPSAAINEGSGGLTELRYTVQRTGDLDGSDTITYSVAGSSANPVDATDFVGGVLPVGSLTFAPGESSRDIVLQIASDSNLESDEGLTITLGSPEPGATVANGTATGTLVNDDHQFHIVVQSGTASEGVNGAVTSFTYVVTRSGDLTRTGQVAWSVAGSGPHAADAADFVGGALPSGVLDFAANEASKTITIQVAGDYSDERDEGFTVSLSSPATGSTIGTASATGTIVNDDTGLAISATSTALVEGDSGTQAHTFTVTRTGVTTGTTTVDWALTGSGGQPVDAADFGGTLPSGSLSFAPGVLTQTITVYSSGDTSVESTEGFTITLSGADGNTEIVTPSATGSVVADDIGISISAGTTSVLEGSAGQSRVLQFTVTRTGDTASPVVIDWAASGMDASDFGVGTPLSGTLSFAANETSKVISLTQTGDDLNESNETLLITLTNPAGNPAHDRTYITTATASTEVTNDDSTFGITADAASQNERNIGDGASTAFTFTVTRGGDLSLAQDIDWLLQLPGGAGSASIGDFITGQDLLGNNGGLPSGTVSFAAGASTATVTVQVKTDDQVEVDEAFNIVLQPAGANTALTGTTASATITNDDTGFSIVATDADKAEGQSGSTTYTFTVTRAGFVNDAATVDWAVTGSGASAANAADFGSSLPGGTLSFAANETTRTISITVATDLDVESDDGFTVTISNAKLSDNTPQNIVDATATGRIVNDDQRFSVSAANAAITEGNSGTTQVAYTITRSGDLSVAATVDYAVTGSNGANTADVAGGVLPTGTLSFGVGVSELAVTLNVNGDTLAEANNETLTLTLSNPSANTTLGTSTASTVINNDDTNFVLSAPANIAEGGSGTTPVVFTVTRNGDTSGSGSVTWALSASAGLTTADFVGNQDALGTNSGLPSGTVSFAAGETSKTITLNVQGDLTLESDETLQVVLGTPVNGTIQPDDGSKSTTLLTDDDNFSISTATTTRAEGNTDSTVTYTVTRSGSLDGARDLTWTITGTNGFATGTDLAAGQAATGTVSFADGQTSATIVVNIKGDSTVESDETMTVTLSNAPANSNIVTAAASTVLTNDDASLTITPLLADKNEGNSAYVDFTFTVTRSGNASQTSTVNWAVDAAIANAVNGTDFYSSQPTGVFKDGNGIPYGSLSFASGDTSKTITLRIAGDSTLEADETLRVNLSNPSSGTEIQGGTADGYVRNDDAEFNITAGTASVVEGDNGFTGTALTYTVTRTGYLSQTNTVNWGVGHTTTNVNDFTNRVNANINPSGTLTFNSGVTTQTITVYAYGDTGVGSIENNETFNVNLSGANAGSSIGATSSYTSTLQNDDTQITASIDDMRVAETVAGQSTTFTVTFTRSGDLNKASSLNWAVQSTSVYDAEEPAWSGSADANDFGGSLPSGTVSFASGETSKTVTITVSGDNVVENDEWFQIALYSGTGVDQVTTVHNDPRISGGRAFYNSDHMGGWVSDGDQYNNTNSGYLFGEIERDEALFDLGNYANTGETGAFNYVSNKLEGDTLADGGPSDDYIEHVFAVRRTIATSGTAWVEWKLSNGISGYVPTDINDFKPGQDALGTNGGFASGRLNFADGQEWGYIKVYTTRDNVGEYDEAFRVYLTTTSGGSSFNANPDGSGYNNNYLVLTNDDTRFDASANDVTEGNIITYTVTRQGDTRGTDTVDWSLTLPGSETTNEGNTNTGSWYKLDPSDISGVTTSNGTATFNAGAWTGTLTFEDGETTKTILVQTVDDSWTETWREELGIVLSNANNINAGEANHDLETASTGYTDTARIYDNEPDPLISVSVNKSSEFEGTGASDSATGNTVTFTVTRTDQVGRDGALNYPTTVAWRIDGTNINWGSAANSAEVMTFGGDATSVTEHYYNQTYGLVSFAAGETTKNVVVTYYGDRYVEDNRTLTFTVLNPDDAEHWPLYTDAYGPANIDNAQASVTTTLKNDDVRLWINGWDTYAGIGADLSYYSGVNTSAYEGNPLTFSVIRGGRLDSDIVVNYTLINGSTAAGDFLYTSGSFTLAAQATSYGTYTYNISLADILNDDAAVEANESFTLRLTAPGDTAGTAVRFQSYYLDYGNSYTSPTTTLDLSGTIFDDDTTYTLTPTSTSLVETDQGANQTFSFDVSRSGSGYSGAATLRWRVEAVGANPTNTADFTSTDSLGNNGGLPSGTVSFANGVLTANFSVLVKGDLIAETNETFRVVIYEDVLTSASPNITNTQSLASSTLTVLTDDTGISIADSSIVESDANQTMNFTVTRSGDLSGTSSMTWTLFHGTTAVGDISGATTGTVSFGAGESSKTISVTVVGDTDPEANETFTVQLGSLSGIDEAIDVTANATIFNDDSTFAITGGAGASTAENTAQTFTITRTHNTNQNQTITWSVLTGGANGTVDAADFGGSLPSGSVTFAPGEMSKTITITPTSDTTPETDETYTVQIALGAGTTGDSITTATATGTIENDDAVFHIAADQATIQEGHSGTTNLTFTVTRGGDTSGAGSVDWKLSSASANAADFATSDILGSNGGLPSGTVSFADGEASKTITIQVVGDLDVEGDESVTLTLSNASGGQIQTATATTDILNDDSTIAISALSAAKAEGNSGTTAYTFTVTRSGYLGEAETVNYAIAGTGLNPADGADFGGSLPSGILTLPAGQSSVTLTVLVSGDLAGEPDEDFTVTLSNPSTGVTITTATANGTIQADDVVFDVTAPGTALEGNPGETTYFDFVVTRSGNLSASQTLDWSVAGIGADPTSAGDFVATSGNITFNAGETSKTIQVPVKGDYSGESNESFRLSLTGPDGVVFTHSTADATITDDEASLRISGTTATRVEGPDSTTTDLTFTVTRSGNLDLAATVDWAATAGTTDAADFLGGVLPSGSLSFASGELSQTITVTVQGDVEVEGNENFTIDLSNASIGADIITGTAIGTITSDDVDWTVTGFTIPSVEGDGASHDFVFRVTRTGGTAATTLDWNVAGNGANAADAADFFNGFFPNGTLSFGQGVMSQDIVVHVAGDSVLESDEGFTVTLTRPTDSLVHSFTSQSANATLVNDDDVMSIAALAADGAEGSGAPGTLSFTVTRTGSTAGNSSVGWRIVHGDTVAGDFVATSGTVTFVDGQDSAVLNVAIAGDRNVELAENFSVELYNPGTGSTVDAGASTAAGTIRDDDVDLALSAAVGSAVEGDTGNPGQLSFTVTRSGDLSVSTSVNWNVVAGSAVAADFPGGVLPSGSVTFAPGETTQTILVNVVGDGLDEGNQDFTVQLSGQSAHADITSSNVIGTIIDDDDTLTVSAVSASQLEGNSGTTALTFRIDRSGTSTGAASVDWNAAGSGLRPVGDGEFVAQTGTVTFADGETSKEFTVYVNADTLGEYDETFSVSLSNPSYGSTASATTATGTVINDDAVLLISADAASTPEGNTGEETPFTFTVTRSGDTSVTSSVLWEVIPSGTNPANSQDFGGVFQTGAVAFRIGETTKTITITVAGDNTGETAEGFSVVLSDAAGATILEGTASTLIGNDDTGLTLTAIGGAEKYEGDSGTTLFTYRLERLGNNTDTVTVNWHVEGVGSYPVTASDFVGDVLPSGSITLSPGQTIYDILIPVAGDNVLGPDQNFRVVLTDAIGIDLINDQAAGVVLNDDSQFSVTAIDTSLEEGNSGGTTAFRFTVTRAGADELAADINWQVTGSGSAPANSADFLGGMLPQGTLHFLAGETSKELVIQVAADTIGESDEQFSVLLSSLGGGVTVNPLQSSAAATIIGDDMAVTVLALDVDRGEGAAGATTPFTFRVLRAGPDSEAITVSYSITGAVNADDFLTPLTGTINLAAGVSESLFTLQVKGDAVREGDEAFNVTFSHPAITSGTTVLAGTIRDDDQGLQLTAPASIIEGDSGSTSATFQLTRGDTSTTETFYWKILGGAVHSVDASDFAGGLFPTGSVTFNAGQSSASFSINVAGDTLVEGNESLLAVVTSSAVSPVALASTTAQITNNDVAGAGNDILSGTSSEDSLQGLGGNDTLYGYAGADQLQGGNGDDVLIGGAGADTLNGGAGADRFHFERPTDGMDVISDFVAGTDHLSFDAGNFGGLNTLSSVSQSFDTDALTTLQALAAQGDASVYRVGFASGSFQFGTGGSGQLDELEAAITGGNHTGSAFFLISNGDVTRLYHDADTNAGTDGSGLVALVELANQPQADTLPTDVIAPQPV